ncbi:hypothetical protein LCGC14_1727820 [marine sediment metagenome]|uniref:Uncharacterized protein n=1 Tax=marine sediment metagenome TaxID=412755 RepID=A0A0F9HY92_9ZZZZ
MMDADTKFAVKYFALFLLIIVGVVMLFSYQESRVFNKLTGADTTMVDALFVQLRVIQPVQGGGE